VAEIYEHRAHVLAGRLSDTPAVALWANAAVALVIGDLDRSADAYAALSARLAVAPDEADERLRFEVLAGLGDARWRQGDEIGARAVLTEAMTIGSHDRRRLARCHEILAELNRRDHRLDAAFSHLQTTRLLEDGFRARAASLATERRAAASSTAISVELEADVTILSDADLERRVESLEQLVDARTRQLERALIDLRDLSDRSHVDDLTQLADRRRLYDVLSELAHATDRCAVMALDVDRFGRVNETLGHDKGDQLLIELAHRLQRAIRARDTVARWGGDEFIVLLPGVSDLHTAAATAEVIRQTITMPVRLGGDDLVPSVSIGVAVASEEQHDTAVLLRQADTALERAKALGKGRVEVFGDELAHNARRRFDMEGLLRTALEQDLFELYFQPVHPNVVGEPLAAEALLRLHEPNTGRLLSPGSFLDVAEETGLARPIGTWVLDAACAAAAGWRRLGVPFRLAVNVSASQLDAGFPGEVESALARHGLPPDTLVIELTEHTLLEADDMQVRGLTNLRGTGVRIALDDFGTAYSSLSHLRRFPVDVVKIDQSFVAGIGRSAHDDAIVRAVVDLSQTFDFQVIAEGVETTEQLDQLRRLGCHGAQGFLIGRPKPAKVFAELLSTRQMFQALARTA
jgi:diguanylate cyclase (GGDEF)-like protein